MGWPRRLLGAMLGALAATLVLSAPPPPVDAAGPRATIKRTAGGIPNIRSRTWKGAGFGYGYAIAEDNLCVLADTYVAVRAERSRYFGPEGSYESRGNGATINNLDSDFFYQRAIDDRKVERILRREPPVGPRPAARRAVRGYVRGYNAYLRDTGVDEIPDPSCRGERWVKPIRAIDAWRRFYQLTLLASQTVAVDGITNATPLVGAGAAADAGGAERVTERERGLIERLGERLRAPGLGSNMYGLGSETTRNGSGMVLANPHFPWDGPERFYQAHVTIPGKLNVSGASLFGVPAVNIGHTRRLAWSHSVSTAFRFTPFELRLVPGSPTTYLVDGRPHEMDEDVVTVKVRGADGSLEPQTRTLYETKYGPVLTSILGIPLFPWTPASAYAMGDVNADVMGRAVNHFFAVNRAQSVGELFRILKRYQGIPWVNTIGADSRGRALYADIGAIPAVPDEKAARCNTALGTATTELLGLPILDGSRSACEWDRDPDAVVPGTFGPGNEPHLFRRDYVANSNDSYWLSNPERPLEGFARIIGDERTARSLRTRLGLIMVEERVAGSDQYPGRRFTRRQLQRIVFNNRQYAGELWRDELVELCEESPILIGSSGPVDVGDACPVLAGWDLRDNLRSRGALLFRRFASHALSSPIPLGGPLISPFDRPFAVRDPVHTPSGLDTTSPFVRAALADAVADLEGAGIPLDAALGDYQQEPRGGRMIPIHGGPGGVGVFNAISASWNGDGLDDVESGSSFVMTTSFRRGCPDDRSILTYSLSTNPASPWYGDQTRMFSGKSWLNPPFCRREVRAANPVAVTRLGPHGAR